MNAINPTTTPGGDVTNAVTPSSVGGTGRTGSASQANQIPVPGAVQDQVQISAQGTKAASYVTEARAIAPLTPEQLHKLKAMVAQGDYPPPALVEGLVNLVGMGFNDGSDSDSGS